MCVCVTTGFKNVKHQTIQTIVIDKEQLLYTIHLVPLKRAYFGTEDGVVTVVLDSSRSGQPYLITQMSGSLARPLLSHFCPFYKYWGHLCVSQSQKTRSVYIIIHTIYMYRKTHNINYCKQAKDF